MRETVACEEVCPCHDECYDGCPCEPRSNYCIPCEEEFFHEYVKCEDECSFRFINCTDTCGIPWDQDCYDQCENQFKQDRKDCPCKENCKGNNKVT